MSIEDIFKFLAVFGGAGTIVVALAAWLGDIQSKRILQREKNSFDVQREALRHELAITKSAYEHDLDLILNYYATFYKHYRLCQRTARIDASRQLPAGDLTYTKDEFLEQLGDFLSDWAAQEGRIRLLLPEKLLAIHEEAVAKFNEFKDAVRAFSPAEPIPRKKETVFREIDRVKSELESGLRSFLRTENLLK